MVQINEQYGWVCPRCNIVLAPFVSECPHCNKDNWSITTTTTTLNGDHYDLKDGTAKPSINTYYKGDE